MKWVIIIGFSLAMCWGVSRFINLGGALTSVAGVPITWAMVVFTGGLILAGSRVK
jgi:hypothetical protein